MVNPVDARYSEAMMTMEMQAKVMIIQPAPG